MGEFFFYLVNTFGLKGAVKCPQTAVEVKKYELRKKLFNRGQFDQVGTNFVTRFGSPFCIRIYF